MDRSNSCSVVANNTFDEEFFRPLCSANGEVIRVDSERRSANRGNILGGHSDMRRDWVCLNCDCCSLVGG